MTNAAIILVNPEDSGNQWLLEKVNSKPFLHFQLSHMEDEFFKHVVIICSEQKAALQKVFGEVYLGIKITYLDWDTKSGEIGNIMQAFEYIDQMQAFVLQAAQHFRMNFSKSDDFRRMRSSNILLIAKKAANKGCKRDKIFLNEKGQVIEICRFDKTEDEDTYNTNAWLINKAYYQRNFQNQTGSLFQDYFKKEYLLSPLYCLACRQYFLHIDTKDDLNLAREDFAEYFYR